MILDGYWKSELLRIKNRLDFWSNAGYALPEDFVEHNINRCLLYSAVIIRKIAEDEKDAESIIKKTQPWQPDLSINKISIPVKRYVHTDEEKLFLNSRVILSDYDAKRPQNDFLPVFQACNQIIHSYAWGIVYQSKKRIYGVLVASDREKEKDVFLLTISDWIDVIHKVIIKSNI